MEKIVFATFVTDSKWKRIYAMPLEKSFKHFHPNIPFVILEGNDVNGVYDKKDPTRNIRYAKPIMGEKLAQQFQCVVLLDADQLILGPLTELIENETFEVAGVRSNDDNGVSLPMGAFQTPCIPWQEYLNCGLVAIRNPAVWDHWDRLNRTQHPYMNDAEQGLWNEVFHSGHYNKELLDPLSRPVIYGSANNRAHWSKLYMDGDKVMLNLNGTPRWVKVIHKAGVGFATKPDWQFTANNFQPAVFSYIQRMIA